MTPRAAVLVLVVTVLLTYLAVPVRTYFHQRDRLALLQEQTEILQQQNARLRERIAQLRDPKYLERIARECLGMVRPGEIAFVVVPRGGRPAAPSC